MAVPNMIVTLVANVKGFSSGLSKASSSLGGFGRIAGRILGGISGLIAGMAIGMAKFSVDSIKNASDLEQALGSTEAVFGKFAKDIEKFSEDAATRMGLSMEQYNRMAAMTGTLLKKAGVPMKKLAGQTDTLLSLAGDLAATFGGTVEEAATAMNAALRGEFEPIRRFGIALSQAQINEQAMLMTHKESVQTLTKRDKMLATQALLLQQGADATGQFARESETLAVRQQVLNAKWDNISATLGEKLLPFAETFVESFTALLDDPKFQGALDNMVTQFVDFGKWITSPEGKKAVSDLADALYFVVDALINTVKFLKDAVKWWKKLLGVRDTYDKKYGGDYGGGTRDYPGQSHWNPNIPTPTQGTQAPSGTPENPSKTARPIVINFNTPVDSVSAGREVARVLADYQRVRGMA